MDLSVVHENYVEFAKNFHNAHIYYAVKANPAAEVLSTLHGAGANFEVASVPELLECLAVGAHPGDIAYTNPIKKRDDIGKAYALGVRAFTTDSAPDLANIAQVAPGSSVTCRVAVTPPGARSPLGNKFGCSQDMAAALLREAARLGLRPEGVAFHPGSQQLNPHAWDTGIELSAQIFAELAAEGIELNSLNLGGGFPVRYIEPVPPISAYVAAIDGALDRHFSAGIPAIRVEPGRAIVATAGVLISEVVLVAKKAASDTHRWVYLDVGRYGGLAETEQEMIAYQLVTGHDGPNGPVILAGPTCDGDDVLYRKTPYSLPLALRQGDQVRFLGAGAYTASYASVFFNGFSPMATYYIPSQSD
ncbi:MAG: type III PLP-dependent enzyme [Corynebacteriales bacterium]|nr:type III PLP-dependent enzyme [Mycobacteriales bacterium]